MNLLRHKVYDEKTKEEKEPRTFGSSTFRKQKKGMEGGKE